MGKGRDALKRMIGRVADIALPHLGREIDDDRNTAHAPQLKRAILLSRLERARARGDGAAIETALAAFWKGNAGDNFHDNYAKERFDLFLEHHAVVIDALADLVDKRGVPFSRLVEIGCGDGTVLAYSADRLPFVVEAVGLDINAAVIARVAAAQPQGGKLSFATAEARDWLIANPKPGTVVLTNGGVLEYFSQHNFDRLLHALAMQPPAAIVLIEPVAPHHDLQTTPDSFVFGHERSFSHNHRRRLNEAGFEVAYENELYISDVRWMLMIGLLR